MKAPVSWIREYVDLPGDLSTEDLAARLTMLGLKLEALGAPGHDIRGPLVVGRVLGFDDEPQKNGKVIRWCSVDVGPELNAANGTGEAGSGVGIVCGAHNFAVDDLVVVVLPGGELPGGGLLVNISRGVSGAASGARDPGEAMASAARDWAARLRVLG